MGTEVDNLLQLKQQKRGGKKGEQEARFSLKELLEDDFEIPDDLKDSSEDLYRSKVDQWKAANSDVSEVDSLDIEDLV